MEQMRKDYVEAVMEKEEQYQSMIKDTNGKFINLPLHFACSLLLGVVRRIGISPCTATEREENQGNAGCVRGGARLGWAEGQSGS